jgi:diguanylate cyclase (GGDEF)-like protein
MQKSLFQLNLSKGELENLLNSIGDFRCVVHSDDTISFPSKSLYGRLGYDDAHILDTSIFGSCSGFALFKSLIKHNLMQEMDWHIVSSGGSIFPVKLSGIHLSETALFIIGTERDEVDDKIFQTFKGIALLDSEGGFCEYNETFSMLFHMFPGETYTIKTLFDEKHIDKHLTLSDIESMASKNEEIEITVTRHNGGEKQYLFLTAFELFSYNVSHPLYALVATDITKLVSSEEKSLNLVHYDPLTGLLNRASLFSALVSAIEDAENTNGTLMLCIISLSEFRDINHVYGHETGDKMLVYIANEIKDYLGENYTVTRLGGDEFAVLCKNTSSEEEITLFVSELYKYLNKKIIIDSHVIHPKIFIGIAQYPHDAYNSKTLLREASIALGRAKKNHRGFAFPNMKKSEETIKKIEISQSIISGCQNNEFFLLYQPQINIKTGEVYGYEALLRWEHPKFGLLMPSVFIPIAENVGMVSQIGLWVFTAVCKQISRWKEEGERLLKISVNIASTHLEENTFIEDILTITMAHQVDPSCIQIEVTESQDHDIEKHKQIYKELVALGFSVAIDDFGTGFSSLVMLRQLYIDTIKIDKSFVDEIISDQSSQDLLKGILFITNALNINVIVEGVETEEQVVLLKQIGFTIFQGYYFSKPLLSDNISEYNNTINITI